MILNAKELYNDAIRYFKDEHTENKTKFIFDKCKEAANMNYMPAINLLGVLYATGLGTPKNKMLARKCFEKCEGDSADVAIYNIGVLNIEEKGYAGRTDVSHYFGISLNKIRNGKLAKLMLAMMNHLAGEFYADASNIGFLMWLVGMERSFCILDADGTIKWTNSRGCIDEQTNKLFNEL